MLASEELRVFKLWTLENNRLGEYEASPWNLEVI